MHGTTRDSGAGWHFFPALYFRNVSHDTKGAGEEQMDSVMKAIGNNGAETFSGRQKPHHNRQSLHLPQSEGTIDEEQKQKCSCFDMGPRK